MRDDPHDERERRGCPEQPQPQTSAVEQFKRAHAASLEPPRAARNRKPIVKAKLPRYSGKIDSEGMMSLLASLLMNAVIAAGPATPLPWYNFDDYPLKAFDREWQGTTTMSVI